MRNTGCVALAVTTALAGILSACVTEEAGQERWEAWVEDHDSCDVVEDCVVIFPGCPLGCFEAVAAEHEEAAVQRAERIIASIPGTCVYDCIGAGEPTCENGQCQVSGRETGP